MSRFKKTHKFKIVQLAFAILFFLGTAATTASLLIPATPAYATTETECIAAGGKWLPQDTATGRTYYCSATEQQLCTLSGGTWQYYGSEMTCLPPGNTSDVGGNLDVSASWTPQQKVMSSIYERALIACMFNQGKDSQIDTGGSYVTSTMVLDPNSSLFPGGGSGFATSVLLDSADDGVLNCNNEGNWLSDALTLWQIPSRSDLLCMLGYVRGTGVEAPTKENGLVGYNKCIKGSGEYSYWHTGYSVPSDTGLSSSFSTVTKSGVLTRLSNARGISLSLDDAHTYLLYKYVFETSGANGKVCGGTQYVQYDKANGDQIIELEGDKAVKVKVVEIPEDGDYKNAKTVDYIYKLQDGSTQSTEVTIAPYVQGSPLYESSPAANGKNTCGYIVKAMNALVGGYLGAVQSGLIDNQAASTIPTCQALGNCAESTRTCAVPGLGWIVCPLFNILAGITDGTYNVIKQFLEVQPGVFDPTTGTYEAWAIARNLANIGFVIVFLLIIFSQVSSIGISNYGVKKMLPRLIVAAVLVNASYFVCQLGVDISNILGNSIQNILTNLPSFKAATDFWSGNNPLQSVVQQVLAGAATLTIVGLVGVAAVMTGVGLLVPILLGALLAVAVTFLILVARQALVVLLVVVAPLAFLAMLLPNTEPLFKQWRKFFIAMLVLFPTIALLYGGAQLAGSILLTSLPKSSMGLLGTIAAAAVGILPLIATPYLLKGSLNAIPIVGNLASKLQTKANGVAGRGVKEFARNTPIARGWNAGKQRRAEMRNEKFASGVMDGTRAGKVAKILAGREGAKSLDRQAFGATEDADTKNVNFQAAMLARQARSGAGDFHDTVSAELDSAIKANDTVRARAALKALEDSGEIGLERATGVLQKHAAPGGTFKSPKGAEMKTSLLSYAHSLGLKGRDNRINKWADNGDDSVLSGGDHLKGLTFQQLAGQTVESLQQGQDAGIASGNPAISVEDAKDILDAAAKGTIELKTGAKMDMFKAIADGTYAPKPKAPTP